MSLIDSHILIVDDDIDVLETARMFLKQQFSNITIESDPKQIPTLLSKSRYDLVLLDMNFKKGVNDGDEGFYWLELILKYNPNIIVVLITAYGEIDLAVEAMKRGATDFVLKPWNNKKLLATMLAALALGKSKNEISSLQATQKKLIEKIIQPHTEFIGNSLAMKRIYELIDKVADTDANVLILGENGTGKEIAARTLHLRSSRKDMPFIAVDMGAISETLFESELFGHKKGAFTDANEDKKGSFEYAKGGTIFLDEIGNLPITLQPKLLSVLQNRLVRAVGSNQDVPISARLICATNMSLVDMVAKQSFRQDLLYRINTVEIELPALRERPEDIELLINHFNEQYASRYNKKKLKLDQLAIVQANKYSWPGNVRELQHAVERAVILSEDGMLDKTDFIIGASKSLSNQVTEPETLDEAEKIFILKKMAEQKGNVTKTAQALGLTRTALYRRMNKHGLV